MSQASISSSPLINSFVRWLRMKKYQYEVTLPLYMMTPTEKLIFNSLFLSFIGTVLAFGYTFVISPILTGLWSICLHMSTKLPHLDSPSENITIPYLRQWISDGQSFLITGHKIDTAGRVLAEI